MTTVGVFSNLITEEKSVQEPLFTIVQILSWGHLCGFLEISLVPGFFLTL